MDSLIITRRMLPLHSDPGGPDITFVAEFRTDEIRNDDTTRRSHILKTDKYGFVPTGKATIAMADSNKRYMAIDSLGVTLWYHGTTTGIAVRSAELVTPQTRLATSGYWDAGWSQALKTVVDSFKTIQDIVYDSTGRHLKVLGFYLPDEYDVIHLLGMRYRLEFLDRRATSETGYQGARTYSDNFRSTFGLHRLHAFPSRFLWTAGIDVRSRQTAVPYARSIAHEYHDDTLSPPLATLGYKIGYARGTAVAPYRNYETDITTNYYVDSVYENTGLPLLASPHDYTTTAAYESYLHSDQAGVGTAAMVESSLYTLFKQTGNWFFSKRRNWWSNFFYHYDLYFRLTDSNAAAPYAEFVKYAPFTGAEVRLAHGLALSFGCRGFIYDKWRHGYQSPPSATLLTTQQRQILNDKVIYPSVEDTVRFYTHSPAAAVYFPGYITEDSTAVAMDSDSDVSAEALFTSDHLGGDYLTPGDSLGIDRWVNLSAIASSLGISRFMPGTDSLHVYVGRRSVRDESRWWHDLVTDTTTRFRRGTDRSNADIFMRTRPVGWYGKGYKTLVGGDSLRLRAWVDAKGDSVKTERWRRASASDSSLVLETEPAGERLYDIVLLDISQSDTAKDADTCVIAVTNRRTSPLLFNNALTDSVEFIASADFDTLTRGSHPELRYKQVGSRRITLPFNYTIDATQPYLLHVRELRPRADSLYTIDTVVSWNSDLAAFYRPGQTRFFKVSRLPATDTLDSGYLAYATQNKMVVYPVRHTSGSGYGDSVRYHMVYHRRDTDTNRPGPWTVYYQRSRPYHKDSLPRMAQLRWEQPLRLSKRTYASLFSNDNSAHTTRYSGIDPQQYEDAVPDGVDHERDCCCGFPSIVIREVAADTPKVFVVYACEDMWAPLGQRDDYFHIVENAFLDKDTLNAAALEVGGKSLAISGKGIGHDIPADTDPPITDYLADTLGSLAKYGTPVINASGDGRMYYAWSSVGSGIAAATKLASEDWFAAQTSLLTIPMPTITWYYSHDGTYDSLAVAGGAALYPSLNVYSNLAQNQTTASLVWEEGGAYNRHIRYTRLTPGGGGTIARTLPAFRELSYDTSSPPTVAVDPANAIAIVGGAAATEEPELPVVVRSLQKDTMSMFLLDSSGGPNGLYRYNHETVAWGEWLPSENRMRVRYNHYVDVAQGGQPNELFYWWANTTGSTGGMSVFHPVLTNGTVRLDSITWQGVVGDSLITYADSLHIVSGNLSDSALIVNYNVMNPISYGKLRTAKTSSYASYWTGQGQHSSLLGQQITVRRMPSVPAPFAITYHYDYLRADGAWPHLSMRQRENMPEGISSVRRILQYDAASAPSLLASAEQFYKEAASGDRITPVTSGGFEVGGSSLVLRAVFSDGRQLTFAPVYPSSLPEGFGGSADYARMMSAMRMPVRELLSEVFTVESTAAMKILTNGLLRSNVELTIEQVEASSITTSGDGQARYTTTTEPTSKTTITLATAEKSKPQKTKRSTCYLSKGNGKLYRLRLKYTGSSGIVFRHHTDLDPEAETFGKATEEAITYVDLQSMRSQREDTVATLTVFPNPTASSVSIIVAGEYLDAEQPSTATYTMVIADALGREVARQTVQPGQLVTTENLQAGTYMVRITATNPHGSTLLASGSFVVVQ